MQLNFSDLEHLTKIAFRAAQKAGQVVASMSGHNHDVKRKTSGSSLSSQVVTEVDLESQKIIIEMLGPTCEVFDLALLSEEREDDLSRLTKDYFWAIDPLDGTLPFIEKKSGYSISISLISREGIPILGIVFDPISDSIFHAIKDHGAYLNGEAYSIKHGINSDRCYLICDRSLSDCKFFPKLVERFHSEVKNLGYGSIKTINHGGAVMNACWSLIKSPACYFKFPKKDQGGGCIWDFGATACIFKEAGGIVCDCFGKPLSLNPTDSVFMNRQGVIFATNEELKNLVLRLKTEFTS